MSHGLPDVGDRIVVSNSEFKDWAPTAATVISRGLRFSGSDEFREHNVMVRLDEHPFPAVAYERMRHFGWAEHHPTITWELEHA